MKRFSALLILYLSTLALTPAAWADNTSSNSSSNSSNGVHTRVDTIVTEDEYGRTIYVRRTVRVEPGYERERFREREKYRWRKMLRWQPDDDEDDD